MFCLNKVYNSFCVIERNYFKGDVICGVYILLLFLFFIMFVKFY